MNHLVAPSLLSADFANLSRDIEMLNQSEADWFHIDIMDGIFVPNISIGFPVIRAISECARKPLDVHLMIVDPDRYIERFAKSGAAVITVHYEAAIHLHRTIHAIKSMNVMAGVVLNPHTPVFVLEDIIGELELVCVMSVNPGFGGQKFIEHTFSKIESLRKLIKVNGSNAKIEVDGGVDLSNAQALVRSGADVLVAGNTVFSSDNPLQVISDLKNLPE